MTASFASAALLEALTFAALKHQGQTRKSADRAPYIHHPIAVATILAREGGVQDTDTLIAALLHDTLEDTDTSEAELQRHFGARVAAIVAELSDDMTLPKPERKAIQVLRAHDCSPPARLVRLADKIANVRDVIDNPPQDWPLERRVRYLSWSGEVVAALRGTHAELEARFHAAVRRGFAALTEVPGAAARTAYSPAE